MKILIPVLGFGKTGGYRVLSKLADGLISLGHTVEFLCPDGSDLPYYPTIARINWASNTGNTTYKFNVGKNKDNAISIQRKLYFGLKNIEFKFDVLFANHSLTILPIAFAGLLAKTVYYIQAYEPEYYKVMPSIKNKILAFISSLTYRCRTFKIVNAPIYKRYKFLESARILTPGIDHDIFYPKTKKAETINIKIGTIGRTEIFKGTSYIIEAFKQIHKKYPHTTLEVAFGNKDLEKIPGVRCIQPDGDEELASYYRGLDYYICGMYLQFGAFHYPVAEAMSCGIPVITTHFFPANRKNSWLIKPKSTEDLIKNLESAILNLEVTKMKAINALRDTEGIEWFTTYFKLETYLIQFLQLKNKEVRDPLKISVIGRSNLPYPNAFAGK